MGNGDDSYIDHWDVKNQEEICPLKPIRKSLSFLFADMKSNYLRGVDTGVTPTKHLLFKTFGSVGIELILAIKKNIA